MTIQKNADKLAELLETTRDFVISAGDLQFPDEDELIYPPTQMDWEGENDPDQLYEYGLFLDFKKNYDSAIMVLEKAQSVYEAQKNEAGIIQCLIELAWLKFNNEGSQGEFKANFMLHECEKRLAHQGLQSLYQELRGRMLHRKGLILYRQNQIGPAVRCFVEAQEFTPPSSITRAKVMDSMAIHYERTADYYRAIKCLRASLDIKKKTRLSYEMAITCQILGRFYFVMEEFVLALRCLDFALRLSSRLEDDIRSANIKNDMVNLLIGMKRQDEALELIGQLEEENKARNLKVQQAETLLYKSIILYARKNYANCQTLLEEEVIPNFRKYKSKKWLGISRRLQGMTLFSLGQERQSIEAMGDAMDLFRESNKVDELARTHFEQGRLYVQMGQQKLAMSSLTEALKIAEQNGLVNLLSYIEDEIYKINKDEWQDIVQKRANHERIFEKQPNLLDALSSLTDSSGEEGGPSAPMSPEQGGQIKSLISLLRVGQAIAGESEVDKLLHIITEETKMALDADRCTVFLYDKEKNELWSKVASGLQRIQEIRFPAHLGIAGYVAKTGEILNIPNAYEDPRFNKEVDKTTGYKTDTILCMPMRNRRMEIIGVFQVLNKVDGPFDKADEDLLMTISSTAGVTLENAKLVNDQKVAFESFIKTLSSTIDARDPITAGHSERVSQFSRLVGAEMKLPIEELEVVEYAALLHDIGKIGIKEEVLTKDGRLTLAEYKHIQKHAYYTYEILKNIHFEGHLTQIPEVAASHHEKMDGTGYFRQLKGTEIPFLGRIVALSDVFDAITSKRHYRSRMPFDKVLGILTRDSGTHFDPDCVDSFFQLPLIDLTRTIMRDRRLELSGEAKDMMEKLDRLVTLREFHTMIEKEPDSRSQGEGQIIQIFDALYEQDDF